MQKLSLRRLFLFSAIFSCLCAARVSAQTNDSIKNAFKEKIEAIGLSPLELLPVSDCRLAEIEAEIPNSLRFLTEKKRRQIDFMRSHIDSLYYIQALQAINQKTPDWQLAEKNIDKALQHNRFFTKAVVFKITCLSLQKHNTQALLQYLNQVLTECSHRKKIQQTAQGVYGKILKETEDLISRKLYRDALDLCQLTETYFLPQFPLRYMRYKEKRLQNMAHQGIYRSFCEVAEKAFSQKQYQLSQRYALQAFDYFNAFEENMDGVNRVMDLLDRIAVKYSHIAEISDMEEKAFYSALVDTIVSRTGIVIPVIEYPLEDALAQDLELLNRSLIDTVPEPEEKPVFAQKQILPSPAPAVPNQAAETPAIRLSPQQARQQFALDCEQARYLNTKRKFSEAYAWFQDAMRLSRQYKLKTDADFEAEYQNTLGQAVEQLINKAVFQLWSHNEARADSLYAQASALFENYRQEYPDAVTELAAPQQSLASYLQKRNESRCRRWFEQAERAKAGFYRQMSFANYASAQQQLQTLDSLLALRNQADFAACGEMPVEAAPLQKIFNDWSGCRNLIEQAFDSRSNGDTLSFIENYRKSERLFHDLELEKYTPAEPSLFSFLSSCGDLRSLLLWCEYCINQKDYAQARFIADYLIQQDYRRKYVEKLAKSLRKAYE